MQYLLCFVLLMVSTAAHAADTEPENLLALVNLARAEARACGERQYDAVPPLTGHAADLAARNELSHTGANGSKLPDRVKQQGYTYRRVGENVIRSPFGVQSAMKSWLKSPGHCANIMAPNFTEFGAAFEGLYGAQVFGRAK
jgi:uncharacterized protein YkwD